MVLNTPNSLETAARILTVMSNQNRLQVLCLLAKSEQSVTELCRVVGLAQSPLSQHLAKLRALNLVTTRRSGQSIIYKLQSPEIERVLCLLKELYDICSE